MPFRYRGDRLCCAPDCILRQFVGVRIARRFARDSAQTETLRGVEACGFQTPVIKREGFAPAEFEEQFAVIAASKCTIDDRLHTLAVEPRLIKKQIAVHRALHLRGSQRGYKHFARLMKCGPGETPAVSGIYVA